MTPRILTLTLNPALDVSTRCDRVTAGEKIRCGPTHMDPGGGGINVSRVAHRLGRDTLAVALMGGLTGDQMQLLLSHEGVPHTRVPAGNDTRESFTVTQRATGEQFRFVLEGPLASAEEVETCLAVVEAEVRPGDIVVGSGSLPPGVPDDFYATLIRRSVARGAKVAIDTSGRWLEPALREGCFVVKPSLSELEAFVGRSLPARSDQLDAARSLVLSGRAECVALSLGSDGALLVTHEGSWHAAAPPITAVSAVGAGDSFLAGLLVATLDGRSWPEALRVAVSAGSVTAESPHTSLCDRESVLARLEQIHATSLES